MRVSHKNSLLPHHSHVINCHHPSLRWDARSIYSFFLYTSSLTSYPKNRNCTSCQIASLMANISLGMAIEIRSTILHQKPHLRSLSWISDLRQMRMFCAVFYVVSTGLGQSNSKLLRCNRDDFAQCCCRHVFLQQSV